MRNGFKSLGVFLFFLGLYSLTQSGRFHVIDEYETFFMAQSFLDRGEFDVPQLEGSAYYFGRQGIDGKLYAPYGVGQPVLSAPFLALGYAIDASLPTPKPDADFWLWLGTSLSGAFYSALAVALLHVWLLRRGVELRAATMGVVLLGAGTLVWAYATQYRSNTLVMALLVIALLVQERKGRAADFLLLALSSAAVLVRSDALLGLMVLGAYRVWDPLARREWRPAISGLLPFGLGCALGLSVASTLNWFHFGNPLDGGYPSRDDLGRSAYEFSAPSIEAAVTLLLSPGKGLLLLSPVLILAVVTLVSSWRSARRECALALGMGLVYLIFYSSWQHFEGGWCFGPRFLLPIVPFLMLPLLISPLSRRWCGLTLVLGVMVNALAVSVNFLAVARGGEYYLNLGDPLRPLSYNFLHNPLPGHLRASFESWRDFCLGLEATKAPGEGLDFWWAFALKESVPGSVVTSIVAVQVVPLAIGLWILLGALGRQRKTPVASPAREAQCV